MTRTLIKFVASALTVAALSAPALAGGQVSLTVTPTDPEAAQAMRTGIGLVSIFQGLSQDGGISQNGMNNMAGLFQNGSNNQGLLIQDGNNQNGQIIQNGDNNSCALIQLGEGTDGQCVQNGDETSATVQFGF